MARRMDKERRKSYLSEENIDILNRLDRGENVRPKGTFNQYVSNEGRANRANTAEDTIAKEEAEKVRLENERVQELKKIELEKERLELDASKRTDEKARDELEEERKKKTLKGRAKGLMVGALTNEKGFAKTPSGTTWFILLAFLLFLFDVIIEYRGFFITDVDPIGLVKAVGSFGYLIGFWALFFYLVSSQKSPKVIASFVALLIFVMISIGLAVRFNPIAMVHIIYIIIFWFFYVKVGQPGPIQSNNILLVFLSLDLYAFSIINLVSPDLADLFVGFPILFLVSMYHIWKQSNNSLALGLIFASFAWYFLMGGPALADNLGLAGFEGVVERLPFSNLGELGRIGQKKLIEEPFEKISVAAKAWLSGKIQYAIHGKVEENQYEPLGVYLERIQSAEPRFYDDEDVIIWGSVKARTLDDPINIKVGCYVKDINDKKKKNQADEVDPNKTFSVFSLEDQDFACRFNFCKLKKDNDCVMRQGSNFITAYADFNFETLGYLKVYFINRERRRAMVREGLDVFDEFDIRDKNPTPVFTNGPAEIGMETNSPLISVSDEYLAHPRLSLTVQNRKEWKGTIKKLKELILFFPKGVELEIPEDYNDKNAHPCNKKFKQYDLETCEVNSCKGIVEKECLEVCDGFDEGTEDRKRCEKSCLEHLEKCKEGCDDLFNDPDQQYVGYILDLKDFEGSEGYDDFEKFKSFNCRLNPIPSEVLGNAPITTKFFRVKARYDYTVEESVTINIQKVPEESAEEIAKSLPSQRDPVVLFKDETFEGDQLLIKDSISDFSAIDFKDASSMKITKGFVATLYDDKNFGGKCATILQDTKKLSLVDLDDPNSIKLYNEFKGAVLYDNSIFLGNSLYYPFGADSSNLREVDDCSNDVELSSIKVAPGYNAILYDGINFNGLTHDKCDFKNNGKRICIKGDQTYVEGLNPGIIPFFQKVKTILDVDGNEINFNNLVRSIKIIEADPTDKKSKVSDVLVTLFFKINREGSKLEVVGDIKDLDEAGFSDSRGTRSFELKKGYVVTLYKDDNYRGKCHAFLESLDALPADINAIVTSVKVAEYKGAIVYEDTGFLGRSDYYGLNDDAKNLDGKCVNDKGVTDDNRVSAIRVGPGYAAILYDETDFKLSDGLTCQEDNSKCNCEDLKCICEDEKVLCVYGNVDYNFGEEGQFGSIESLKFDGRDEVEVESLGLKKFNDKASSIKIVELDEVPATIVCDTDETACLDDDKCPDQTLGDEGKWFGEELFNKDSNFGNPKCSGDDEGEYYLSIKYFPRSLEEDEDKESEGSIKASCDDLTDCVALDGSCVDETQGPNPWACIGGKWDLCDQDDHCDRVNTASKVFYCNGGKAKWVTEPPEGC